MSTLGERILAVRKAQTPKMSQTVFGESLGATLAMIKSYELDRVIPSDTFKTLLCKTYHVNPRWLDTGEGEMLLELPDDIHQLVESRLPTLSPFARRTMERLLSAPPEMWAFFESVMRDALTGALEERVSARSPISAPGDSKTPDE